MFILILISVILIFILYKVKFKDSYNGFPVLPGALPILGHAFMFLGDTRNTWKSIKKISLKANENDGYVAFMLGPLKFYVCSDPDDAMAILNTNPEKHYVYLFGESWLGKGLLTADFQTWSSHRKILYPMFGQQYLNTFMPIFNKQSKKLVERFSEKLGKGAFDHEPDALITGLETICQTALGSDVGERMSNNKGYVIAINGMLNILAERFTKFWLHSTKVFEWSPLKKLETQHLEIIDKLSKELIDKRRLQLYSNQKIVEEDLGDIRPFIDALLKAEFENETFTDKQIRDEVNTLVITGYETTATGLVYSLMLLGHYQHVQMRAYNEIQEVFEKSDRDVDKTDFSKLVYLDAVVKEALRMYPLISIVGRKVTTDVKLKKYNLKAGDSAVISIYGLHRHPDWGPDADEFRPERWLDPQTLPKNPNLWAPFGLGKRYCVGKTYALMAMKTSLVHVLRNYKVTSDFTKLTMKMDVITKPALGQHIILEPRNS